MSERHKHEVRHSSKRRSRFRTHEARQGGSAGPRACLEELYELRREIGRGATSIVYEARSRLTGDAVAVKTVPKAALDMKFFASEVRIMRSLRHPNIVALLDVVESEDCVHLVMELCVTFLSSIFALFFAILRFCSTRFAAAARTG